MWLPKSITFFCFLRAGLTRSMAYYCRLEFQADGPLTCEGASNNLVCRSVGLDLLVFFLALFTDRGFGQWVFIL
jgi:hypothetical protein